MGYVLRFSWFPFLQSSAEGGLLKIYGYCVYLRLGRKPINTGLSRVIAIAVYVSCSDAPSTTDRPTTSGYSTVVVAENHARDKQNYSQTIDDAWR